MTKRICFLGRGGSGKSTIAQNISHALAGQGVRVLLIGNDVCLSTSVLLRQEATILPALEDYRKHYEIDLHDYILPTASGVFCMELGSIDPGAGCLARSINLIDEMLEEQDILEEMQLDMILYDISGETTCTGYILPIREGIMHRSVIITTGSFASVTTTNSILQGIVRAANGQKFPVQLLVNNAGCCETEQELVHYAARANIHTLAQLEYSQELEYSALAGKTIFDTAPESSCAKQFKQIAADLQLPAKSTLLTPVPRQELTTWLREWQQRELARRLAAAEQPAHG